MARLEEGVKTLDLRDVTPAAPAEAR